MMYCAPTVETPNPAPIQPKPPESISDTLGKLWDKFIQKETTEVEKKRMTELLNTQKTQLNTVIDNYQQGRDVIVGKSGQEKAALLMDLQQTINDLRNMSGDDMTEQQRKVMEDRYDKLEH